jgi:hypothetical protein
MLRPGLSDKWVWFLRWFSPSRWSMLFEGTSAEMMGSVLRRHNTIGLGGGLDAIFNIDEKEAAPRLRKAAFLVAGA